jgi:hypothetical protein
MGKRTPFEGELDRFGNPTCGQSFMGGTLCSLPPNHEGFCGSDCQNCGGDWLNDTCDCYVDDEEEITATCANCRSAFTEDEGAGEFAYGPCCGCNENRLGHGKACHLLANHDGPCSNEPPEEGPSDEELAEAYRSLGVAPPV